MKLHPHNLKPDRHPSAWRLLAVVCLLGLLVGNLTAGKKIRFSGKTAFQSVRDTERFEERALLIEKEGMELRLQGKDELIVGEVNHMARKRRVLLDAEDDDDEDKDGNPAPMTATRAIEKRMERMTRPSGLSKRSREVLSRDKKKEKEREEGSDPDGMRKGMSQTGWKTPAMMLYPMMSPSTLTWIALARRSRLARSLAVTIPWRTPPFP